MIKINNVVFTIDELKISWGKFLVSSKGHKREGISPYITFYISDDFGNKNTLSIETTYSSNEFEMLKENKEIDFSKYISDICYTENGMWDSIIIGDYTSRLTKLDKNKYKILLKCYYKDLDYIVDLNLEETLEINK